MVGWLHWCRIRDKSHSGVYHDVLGDELCHFKMANISFLLKVSG